MNENKGFPLKIDQDTCPDKDFILYHGSCTNCDYYLVFKLIDGDRYIQCSYPEKRKNIND